MPKVIARIVIDMDDWDENFPHADENPVVQWRRTEIAKAHPFSESELNLAGALLGDQYFV